MPWIKLDKKLESMELSMLIIIGLSFLFVSLIIAYFTIKYLRPSSIHSLEPREGPLKKVTPVGTSEDVRSLFQSPSAASFSVYLYLYPTQRTATLQRTPTTEAPSLFKLGSSLEFQLLAAGASNKEPTARIRIKTSGPTSAQDEYINVPFPPVQQWVLLTLVRDARRYTLYYNEKAVASGRTVNYPINTTTQLTIGGPDFQGKFGLPIFTERQVTLADIKAYRGSTADTRGKPFLPSEQFKPSLSGLPSVACPSGLCSTTSGPPTNNPLQRWVSPYA